MKLNDDWDAPYTSPIRGALMLAHYTLYLLALTAVAVALLLARATVGQVLTGQ